MNKTAALIPHLVTKLKYRLKSSNNREDSRMELSSNIKGDLSGAFSAAIITLPMSIGYGLVAYSPLGIDFAPSAALLGIYSAAICCILVALFGGTPIQISGPKAPLTLALGAVVAKLVFDTGIAADISMGPSTIIGLASLTVLIAGLSQLLFGAIGLGNIVKYVPQPVVAGFMNGIALLLIVKQIKPLIGIDNNVAFFEIVNNPSIVKWSDLITGITTITSIILAKRYLKIVPSSFVGLGIGTTIYYLLQSGGDSSAINNVIGHIQSVWPEPYLTTQFFNQLKSIDIQTLLPNLLISGIVIGLIGSMESLLSSVVTDNMTNTRHNSKKELIGQGTGNIACSIFGALPGAGSIPRSIANYRAGGRTRLSGIFCGLFILLLTTFFGTLIGKIPLAAIAGIITIVGISLFDGWSFSLIKRISGSMEHRKIALINLCLTTIVTVITISINLIAAVICGIIISSALFITKVGKSIVRRQYSGDRFHSRRMRNKSQTDVLERVGKQISVIELQGPLFFGSAEHLAAKIDKSLENSPTYFILDMKRVNEIDSTGANIILRVKKKLESLNKFFLLSNVKQNSSLWEFLEAMNVTQKLDANSIFPDTDSALEWSEDQLLKIFNNTIEGSKEVPISEIDLLRNLSSTELNIFSKNLVSLKFAKGEKILEEGDSSRDLYLLKSGSVTVAMNLPEKKCCKRLYTFSPGIVFGEVAFLDGGKRSAGIWAHENTEVLKYPYKKFQDLQTNQPELAAKLIRNIALELSHRLRRISNQMRLMEDQ